MLRRWWLKILIIGAFAGIVVSTIVVQSRPTYTGIRAGRPDENYVDSSKCVACHKGHYESWHRTYHRTMTQNATPETVQGDFTTNNNLEYAGVKARMEKRADGFYASFTYPDGTIESNKIVRTIGSRRIQQYLIKEADSYIRIPVAYDLVNRRWMNLNGSFFNADGGDFSDHRSTWDNNCVFCHNVKAQPKFNFETRKFAGETEVAELGIACGACHGQTAQHIDQENSIVPRFLRSKSVTPLVVNPEKLTAERSTMMCGHCHGQRVPEPLDRLRSILGVGDPYNSGEDLSTYYTPVQRDTTLGTYSFASRFWNNGSPRLTAFEYQGLTRSACYRKAKPDNHISCISCHSMHDGDPQGMILPVNRTNTACLKCHGELRDSGALTKHTGHTAASAGSSCYSCHMPPVVYGVMSFHPSHDISIPNPELTATQAVPNACNVCHVDRSVNWAITESKRIWPTRFGNAQPSTDPMFNEAEGPRMLFAGDALTRSLAANILGGDSPVRPDSKWAGPYLLEAAQRDNYAIVRYFAANGLARINGSLPKPDYLGTDEARRATATSWTTVFDEATRRHAAEFAGNMRKRRSDTDLDVGE